MNSGNTVLYNSETPLTVVMTVGYPMITLFLQVKTRGNVALSRKLEIEVCGTELLSNNASHLTTFIKVTQVTALSGVPDVPKADYAAWFNLASSGVDGTRTDCVVTTCTLCVDAACSTLWTDYTKVHLNNGNTATDASATPLTVVLTTGYPLTTLYLQAKTMGLVVKTR